MKIVEVIPIIRGGGVETLWYFSKESPEEGALVEVPVRAKKVKGVVKSTREAGDLKMEIKSSPFSIKKAEVKSEGFIIDQKIVRASEKVAEYFASSASGILYSILPKEAYEILEKESKKDKTESNNIENSEGGNKKEKVATDLNKKIDGFKERIAIQGEDDERYGSYKSLIRQKFAQKKSVFFVVPTIEETETAKKNLEKGIEDFTIVLSSNLSTKKLKEGLSKIETESHPLLIIGTAPFLTIPRDDVGAVIIERSGSRNYRTQNRPYIDLKKFAEFLCEEKSLPIYFGDSVLPVDILYRETKNEVSSGEPFKGRILGPNKCLVVDMKEYKAEIEEFEHGIKGKFRILSDETLNLIRRTKEESKRIFIFNVRKGLAPQTVCADCGETVLCSACKSPMVLYPSQKYRDRTFFMCQHCGSTKNSEELCAFCGSWKLQTLGIGIDMVEREIKNIFKDVNLFRIDKDACPKESDAKNVSLEFYKSPGGVMLGTEMALRFLSEKIEYSSVITIDSLFSLPEYKINESIFYILSSIRNLTAEEFIIQTRKPDEKVFEYASRGNILDFWRGELKDREKYNYPPYSVLIKITIIGKKEQVVDSMKEIQAKFEAKDGKDGRVGREIGVFPSFTYSPKGDYILHGLLRIPRSDWPDQNVIQILKMLPPSVEIKVDPDTLL